MADSSSSGSSAVNTNPFADPPPNPPAAATIAMINIKAHIPVTLEMEAANFRQWRTFFELAFKKFSLLNHVDGTLDAVLMRDDVEWMQIDSSIVSWLYTSVSKAIMDDVYQPQLSAFSVWSKILGLFLDNGMQRAVYTLQEFHSLYQGDMSVDAYYSRLKKLADTLHDVGSPVSDPALVVNTLCGLNSKFSHGIANLTSRTPPPDFFYTHNYLVREETRIAETAKMEAATALMAAGSSSQAPTPPPSAPPSFPSSLPPAGNNGDRCKKRKKVDGHNGGPGAVMNQ